MPNPNQGGSNGSRSPQRRGTPNPTPPAPAGAPRAKALPFVVVISAAVLVLLFVFAPAAVVLLGLVVLGVAVYVLIRGAAPRLRLRSRASAGAALAVGLALMLGGGGANAMMHPETATPEGPQALPAPPATAATPTPAPVKTTFDEIQESTSIPFEKTTVDDPQRDVGTTAITTAGVAGTKVTTYRVEYHDGVEISRLQISEEITVPPVNEVTSRGTKQPVAAPAPFVEKAQDPKCHPSYAGVCVPFASDVDCAGGKGDGPAYVRGPVRVIGPDVYKLDRDGDGIACEK